MTVKDVLFAQFGWWIQFFLTIAIFVLGAVQFYKLYVLKSTHITRTNINATVIMGITNAIIGITMQILTIVLSLEAIIRAADVSPQIVMQGFTISFYTTLYGLFVLIISIIIWYANKIKWELNLKQKNS